VQRVGTAEQTAHLPARPKVNAVRVFLSEKATPDNDIYDLPKFFLIFHLTNVII